VKIGRARIHDSQHLDLLYCGTASIKFCGAIVGMFLDILKPEAVSKVQNSARVRSRPELAAIIFKSRILPKCFESFSSTTVSSNSSRPVVNIASRQFLRMVTARSSSQSCTTLQRKYKSPPRGTDAKRSPAHVQATPGPWDRTSPGSLDGRGAVENRALDLRIDRKDCLQESAVASANVHNRGDTAELVSKNNSVGQHSSQARHTLIERIGGLGILVQNSNNPAPNTWSKAGEPV